MDEDSRIFIVGAAKCIGERIECIPTLVTLYKAHKRYWNRKCEHILQRSIVEDNISTPGVRMAVMLVILAEQKSFIKKDLLYKIYNVYFTKLMDKVAAGKISSGFEEGGAEILLYHYYLHLNSDTSHEYLAYREMFPKIYKLNWVVTRVEDALKGKKAELILDRFGLGDRFAKIISYVMQYYSLQVELDQPLTRQESEFAENVAELVSMKHNEKSANLYLVTSFMNLAKILISFRDKYLKLAMMPEIKHDRFTEAKSRKEDLERIARQEKELLLLRQQLADADAVCKQRINTVDKEHKATIAKMRSDLKLLQEGKKIKTHY